MPKHIAAFLVNRKLLICFGFAVILMIAMITLNQMNKYGALVPLSRGVFKSVVGVNPPPGVVMIKHSFTDFTGENTEWLSFSVSKQELLKIISEGQFKPEYGAIGLGDNPTQKELSHRPKSVINLGDFDSPSWWQPTHEPDHYFVYSHFMFIDAADYSNVRYLVTSPSSNIVFAVSSIPR